MSDEVDQANDQAQFLLDQKLREMMSAKQYGPAECDDCGEPVPEPRRKLGLRICVDCAWEREVLARTIGRP